MTDKKGLNPNRLNGKDLINAGIFSAIYVVIIIAVACTLGLIPIGFLLLTFVVPFVEGIPMMLYFTKIKKFGMLIILNHNRNCWRTYFESFQIPKEHGVCSCICSIEYMYCGKLCTLAHSESGMVKE